MAFQRRAFPLIVAALMAIVLTVCLLPRDTSKASVTINRYLLSPQGQVTSTNVGACKASMTYLVTAPDAESASRLKEDINGGGAFGLFKEDVKTVSSKVISVGGGGTELQVRTEVEFKCDHFKSADWKEGLKEGGISLLGAVVGGIVYHIVNTLVLGFFISTGLLPTREDGTDRRRKIAGCIAGAANGLVTMATVALTGGKTTPYSITGYMIGSCLKGTLTTGWDPIATWEGLRKIFTAFRAFSLNEWMFRDVLQAAAGARVDLEQPVAETFGQVATAMTQCAADPTPNQTPCG